MRFDRALTIGEVAEIINAEIIGNKDDKVYGLNEIHRVEKGDITFVDHPKYYFKVLNSFANAVIINNREVDNPLDKILLYVDDPFEAFNILAKKYRKLF